MGLEGISVWQLLILLAIVIAIFGTKKLRNVGGDLGAAIRDFRGATHKHDKEGGGKDAGDGTWDDDDDHRVVDHQSIASMQTRNTSDASSKEAASESVHNKD